MKEIKVKDISGNISEDCLDMISTMLDTFDKHKIDNAPWPEFPGKPTVTFTIAHNSSNIFLKYFIEEKHLRAVNNTINSPVHEDSCVEFFLSFDDGATYYNIECNCIGTILVGYGPSKQDRLLLGNDLVNNLKSKSFITSENGNGFSWQLTLAVPLNIFIHTPIEKLTGVFCKANFYKCGDLLPEPHFISWSNIVAESPNFHLPEFFGRLVFE